MKISINSIIGKVGVPCVASCCLVSLGFLSCSSDDSAPKEEPKTHTPMEFVVGMDNPFSHQVTRTTIDTNHKPLTDGTNMKLSIQGKWYGHTPQDVVVNCDGKVGGLYDTYTDINNLTFATGTEPTWEMFGTFDPDNKVGREEGVSVYGVAIDAQGRSKTTITPPDFVTDDAIQTVHWSLNYEKDVNHVFDYHNYTTSGGKNLYERDLLITNNISPTGTTPADRNAGGSKPGTYKFDYQDWTTYKYCNLIEFKHAMSMFTAHIIAGKDWPKDADGGGYFEDPAHPGDPTKALHPELVLVGNNAMDDPYVYTGGTVNITDGTVVPAPDSKQVMYTQTALDQWECTEYAGETSGSASGYQPTGKCCSEQKQALLFPHTPLGRNADNDLLGIIVLNGNKYYIPATEMRKAMKQRHGVTEGHTDWNLTRPGYNYILRIRLDKTAMTVEAMIDKWGVVSASELTWF